MTNVITLPEREKLPISSQRQRVFYLGFVYRGPPLMQEVQNVYLKRHVGKKELDDGRLLPMANSMNGMSETIHWNSQIVKRMMCQT